MLSDGSLSSALCCTVCSTSSSCSVTLTSGIISCTIFCSFVLFPGELDSSFPVTSFSVSDCSFSNRGASSLSASASSLAGDEVPSFPATLRGAGLGRGAATGISVAARGLRGLLGGTGRCLGTGVTSSSIISSFSCVGLVGGTGSFLAPLAMSLGVGGGDAVTERCLGIRGTAGR